MERFLAVYGLSTKGGVALTSITEAMLRVPDSETMDALIEDKITPSNWEKHQGGTSFSLVNASTCAYAYRQCSRQSWPTVGLTA
jgi:RHH-type proline utilization regulon transcriptional repressor/proline dehydrogenase/delta 1-pyrroline-5-carboxylate dehydrogenase